MNSTQLTRNRRVAFRIVAAYVALTTAWLFLSQYLTVTRHWLIANGIINALFVGASALVLYLLAMGSLRKQGQVKEQLRTNEDRLNLALEASHMGVWEWDLGTDQVVWSPECYDLVGLKDFDGSFASFAQVLYPADAERVMATVRTALEQRSDYVDEFRIIRPDSGEVRWLANLGRARYDEEGTPLVLLGTVRDITGLKRAEEELRGYSRRMIELEEEMRRKLSAELHDEIGRDLTALSINISLINANMSPASRQTLGDRINDSGSLVKSISHTIRELMGRLRPPVLDDFGLEAALSWYADLLSRRSGVRIELMAAPFPRFQEERELALFRIAQEAITNAVKHAGAKLITVSLERKRRKIRLAIRDDGQGFVPGQARHQGAGSGWGITIMKERAEAAGGSFRLDSAPGTGTTILVEVPEE